MERQDVIRLEPLATRDAVSVDALLDAAFGADRRGRTAYAIRRGMAWLTHLSFAAIEDETDAFVGLVQSWPIALHQADGTQTPLIMAGPVAVLPGRQGAGIGRALMDRFIAEVDRIGTEPLTMIGDEPYYGRFWGFTAQGTGGWTVPGPVDPARLLVRHSPGAQVTLPERGALGPRLPVPVTA